MFTRDQLVEALKSHRQEIVEADEWRPLAEHVLALIELIRMGWDFDSAEDHVQRYTNKGNS